MTDEPSGTPEQSDNVIFVCTGGDREMFRVTVDDHEYRDVSFRGVVDEVTAWDRAGRPIEFERYLTCSIKWDSCSHFYFGDPGNAGYLHLCGLVGFTKHVWLMEELYRLAFDRMGREPMEGEVWPDD